MSAIRRTILVNSGHNKYFVQTLYLCSSPDHTAPAYQHPSLVRHKGIPQPSHQSQTLADPRHAGLQIQNPQHQPQQDPWPQQCRLSNGFFRRAASFSHNSWF